MSFNEKWLTVIELQDNKPDDSNVLPAPTLPATSIKPKDRQVKKSGSFMRRDRRNNSRLKPKKNP
jgi:hypothetical protein